MGSGRFTHFSIAEYEINLKTNIQMRKGKAVNILCYWNLASIVIQEADSCSTYLRVLRQIDSSEIFNKSLTSH